MSGRRYARRSRECRRLLIGILNEGQFSPRFGHQTGFRCAGRPDPNFDNVPFRLYFLSPWFLPIHFYTKFYAVSNLKKSLDENRLAYSGNILSCLDAKSSETRPHGTGLSQKTHPCGIKCNSPLRSPGRRWWSRMGGTENSVQLIQHIRQRIFSPQNKRAVIPHQGRLARSAWQ